MADDVRITAAIDARQFDVDATLAAGRVTAIVGPNGSGKSTLVGLVSGELRPDRGSVSLGLRVLSDAAAHVPTHRRSIALLAQRPLLFPHLDVLDNVAFGVRARGAGKAEARERALRELDAVGAAPLASRRARALSGGEAQRVALARALATDPAIVLLDEPLASLDVATAGAMRALLAERLPACGATVALVTHDPLDIWTLADDLVCLEAGRLVESGPIAEVLARPRTGFLADLSGVNLLEGTADPHDPAANGVLVGADRVLGLWEGPEEAVGGQHVMATFAPSAVALFRTPPAGSPRNTWDVRVVDVDPRGATVRVNLTVANGQRLSADLSAPGAAALSLAPGDQLHAQVKATQVFLYPRH